jgi:hypothetical protein
MTRLIPKLAPAGLALTGLLLWPQGAQSHQRHLFHVGQSDYLFVVGSLDEPVFTGDKSGVDLTVLVPDAAEPMDSRAKNVKPVEGLEKTLKVEVKAGPRARIFELEPRFREPGKYDAVFYPTVATTYTCRIFGTVNGAPFDVTFACSPAGHVATEDASVVKVGNDVTRKGLRGSFGWPRARSEAEFPPTR